MTIASKGLEIEWLPVNIHRERQDSRRKRHSSWTSFGAFARCGGTQNLRDSLGKSNVPPVLELKDLHIQCACMKTAWFTLRISTCINSKNVICYLQYSEYNPVDTAKIGVAVLRGYLGQHAADVIHQAVQECRGYSPFFAYFSAPK
jgi:hypothetical protein